MARRRGAPDTYTFDLVPDDEAEVSAPLDAAPEERPGLRERTVARLRSTTRRQRAVAAGTALGAVLAVAGGAAIAAAVQAHQLAERLRSAPGGVVGLSAAITETWALEDGSVHTVLPDGGILTSDGESVVAVDVTDGTELWRVDVGTDVDCGPQPRFQMPVEWTLPSAQVVCLAGPADARTVTVLDAEGTVVGRRELDDRYAADGVFLAPAAHGALAVLERSGTLPERIEAENTDELFPRLEEGWVGGGDAVLRLEDALTGETRVETSAPSRAIDHLWECAHVTAGPDGAAAEFDAGASLVASPVVVEYRHCGVDLALTSDGKQIDWPDVNADRGWFERDRAPYPDGGFVTSSGPERSRIVDTSGEVLVDVPGWLVPPLATDGTGDDVVLAVSPSGELTAFERDGSERWRSDGGYGPALVRAAGVVVIDLYGALAALDLRTGEEVWRTSELSGEAGDRYATPYVLSAVTDGATALVALAADGASPQSTVVRLDLATGEVTPTGVEIDGMVWLSAVDGNVIVQVAGIDRETGMYGTAIETVRGLGPA